MDALHREHSSGIDPKATGPVPAVVADLLLLLLACVCAPALALAPGDPGNGAAVYNDPSLRCKGCHLDPATGNKNNVRNGANTVRLYDALLFVPEMASLPPPTNQQMLDIAAYIASVLPTAPGKGMLQVIPFVQDFGSVGVGSQGSPKEFTLYNIGSAPATVKNVQDGENPNIPSFSVVGGSCQPYPHTVAVGGSCTIDLVYHPTELGYVGTNDTYFAVSNDGALLNIDIGTTGTGTNAVAPTIVTVVEYHHSEWDHYFVTPIQNEITLLDAAAPPLQDWSRTGFTFKAYASAGAPASTVAICRFFNTSFTPKSTHFYAPKGLGCEDTIAKFPDWQLETDDLFNADLPDANGNCPAGEVPVYRLYNNGMGGAPNHRFVTDLAERQKMLDRGYVPEGAGIGVGWCAPQ